MPVQLDGDFVNTGGVESFVWDDPCGGPQLTGGVDQDINGAERPFLDAQFVGSCRPDDRFFNHELSVEHPSLLFEDYADLDELIAGCCTGSGTPSSSTESGSLSDGVACNFCPKEDTSKFLRVTISNAVAFDGCHNCPTQFIDKRFTNVPDINGTYILTQVPGFPCIWQYSFSTSFTIQNYSSNDGNCNSPGSLFTYTDIVITIQYVGGGNPILFSVNAFETPPGAQLRLARAFYTKDLGCVSKNNIILAPSPTVECGTVSPSVGDVEEL